MNPRQSHRDDGKEPRGKVLDVPMGTGILTDRLRKIGFEVSCCDFHSSYFSVPDLKIELGDLNQSLPYPDRTFDYLLCLDGIEHTESPSNAIREFQRVLKKGGELFLSFGWSAWEEGLPQRSEGRLIDCMKH
jgi:ubiquinone/menaquinone biosynthesis C-methylase UbiE